MGGPRRVRGPWGPGPRGGRGARARPRPQRVAPADKVLLPLRPARFAGGQRPLRAVRGVRRPGLPPHRPLCHRADVLRRLGAVRPHGRYSTLAGFTEMAESLEASALREVLEESGVRGDPAGLRFLKTQPWPFPRSLMA